MSLPDPVITTCAARAANASAGCPFDGDAISKPTDSRAGKGYLNAPSASVPVLDLLVGREPGGYLWRLVLGFYEDVLISNPDYVPRPGDGYNSAWKKRPPLLEPNTWLFVRANSSDAGDWTEGKVGCVCARATALGQGFGGGNAPPRRGQVLC